jgi:hypothetical protein
MNACKYCGCTQERACIGGCHWIDEERSVCSACLPLLPHDDLFPLYTAEILAADEIEVEVPLVTLTVLVGLVQLALRHPQIDQQGRAAQMARRFIESLADHSPSCEPSIGDLFPAIGETIRRGFLPQYDVPVQR